MREEPTLDLWCLRWWALVKDADATNLTVSNGSEEVCLVKRGESERVMVEEYEEEKEMTERKQSTERM